LGVKTCGARREKCKEASGGGGSQKARDTAASVVGEWRGVRTTAQQPPSDARSGLAWRASDKTGEARGRGSWQSSLLGDPGAKFLCAKLRKAGRKRKGAIKREGRSYPRAELDRREQVTATKSWPSLLRKGEAEVANQVA